VRDALLVRVRSLVGGSGRDRGAAVAEFAMISVLLVFLLFSVLQVAVYCYVRNVVAASPADGARFAAAASVDYVRGGFRASDLVGKVLPKTWPGCTGAGWAATHPQQAAVDPRP
jgi:Flp pilus assembly protein TadG